jgi:NAD(P)-dependent dehydrogenase (short-subunit alcohol dehydrogenase family)
VPSDRTVLVTGANSGIGLALVLELARRGHRVVGSVRSADKAVDVEQAARAEGVSIRTVLLDVDDADRCREVIEELRPWALVNNAGYARSGAVEEVSDDEGRAQLETLAVAPIRLARLALPAMREQGGGRILNISSMVSEVSAPLMGWYQAAKRALEGLSDALRTEVRSDGVLVSLVEPGMTDTAIWDDASRELDRPTGYAAARDAWIRIIRLARPVMASPESIARTVADALESSRPRARYLVGIDAHLLVHAHRWMPAPVTDLVTRTVLRLG